MEPSNTEFDAIFSEIVEDIDKMGSMENDSDVQEVLDRAITINRELQHGLSLDTDEKQNIIAELDRGWNALGLGQVLVSSVVQTYPIGDESTTILLQESFALSNGFDMVPVDGVEQIVSSLAIHPGEVPAALYDEVAERFGIDAKSQTDDMVLIPVFAQLDDISIHSNEISSAKAVEYMETCYPSFTEEINRRLNLANLDEDKTLALRGLDINSWMDASDKIARAYLQLYLQALVQVDRTPFGVQLTSGHMWAETANGESRDDKVTTSDEVFIASLGEIHIINEGSDVKRRWSIAIDALLEPQDFKDRLRTFCIPLDSIEKLQPTRRLLTREVLLSLLRDTGSEKE